MDEALRRLNRSLDDQALAARIGARIRSGELPPTLTLRVVYEGAPLVGKTSNLERLHKGALPRGARGDLVSRALAGDRLLGFKLNSDRLAPLELTVEVLTVPGACYFLDLSKSALLLGADGLVFVLSGRDELDQEAHVLLEENLAALNRSDLPRVYQANRLPGGAPDLAPALPTWARRAPLIPACAREGAGVAPTLEAVLSATSEALLADPQGFVERQRATRAAAEALLRPRHAATLRELEGGACSYAEFLALAAADSFPGLNGP